MLAITPGEPAGIGPDLLLALAQASRTTDWIVLADVDMLRSRSRDLGLETLVVDRPTCAGGELYVEHVPLAVAPQPGIVDAANAAGILATLDRAIAGCLSGEFRALVTGPVNKALINEGGFPFTGHTEYLAEACSAEVQMLLVAGEFRVALATTHLPLRAVPDALTRELIERQLRLLNQGLVAQFGIGEPRILVAGLNPHAGEEGHLGREEIEIIEPVCATLRDEGMRIEGPLPADTLFTPAQLDGADAVLAMYHDQGLPVLKHAGFGEAVNVTLGLPFVRTSVDHGTALSLAGTGKADSSSLAAAIDLASGLVSGAARTVADRAGT